MTARILKDAPSVQRVMFGRYVTPTRVGHCESPILSFTSKTPGPLVDDESSQPGGLISITSSAETRLRSALQELEFPPYSLEAGKGPYADKAGTVQRLTQEVVGDAVGNNNLIIDRVMDLIRPFAGQEAEFMMPRIHHSEVYNFMFGEGYAGIPDVLPYAGEILTQRERSTINTETGAPSVILTHVMEPFVLAASVLRRAGLVAYPSLAVWADPQGLEMYTPILSVVDLTGDVPLRTFALMRAHPNLSSIILMSDAAVMGVLNVIVAETRAKHLCMDIVEHNKQGRDVPKGMVENQLKRVANALFEGHRLWPGTHFITDAITLITNEASKAIAVVSLLGKEVAEALEGVPDGLIAAFSSPQPFGEICMQIPGSISKPLAMEVLGSLLSVAAETGQEYADAVLAYISVCTKSGRPMDTFEGNRKQPGQ